MSGRYEGDEVVLDGTIDFTRESEVATPAEEKELRRAASKRPAAALGGASSASPRQAAVHGTPDWTHWSPGRARRGAMSTRRPKAAWQCQAPTKCRQSQHRISCTRLSQHWSCVSWHHDALVRGSSSFSVSPPPLSAESNLHRRMSWRSQPSQ
ncbi:hypothetical protein VTK56DRAFT_3882 [Thermocarpiscus australiensis]